MRLKNQKSQRTKVETPLGASRCNAPTDETNLLIHGELMKLSANNTHRMPLQSYDIFVKRVPYKGRATRTDYSHGHRFNKKPSVTIVYRPNEFGELVRVN
jgi:archaellum component FlaF (FlaF/FlaG flagellin family)